MERGQRVSTAWRFHRPRDLVNATAASFQRLHLPDARDINKKIDKRRPGAAQTAHLNEIGCKSEIGRDHGRFYLATLTPQRNPPSHHPARHPELVKQHPAPC